MQISSGTVTVTSGSATVEASPNNDWSDVLIALGYGSPVYFMLLGSTEVPRSVVGAQSPSTSASGNWELTLAAPWNGATQVDVAYLIHKDFTLNLGLALATAGEQGWAQLFSDNMEKLDLAVANQNVAFPTPAIDGATGTPGAISVVRPGKTLYASGVLDVPADATLDVLPGGVVEVG